MCPLAAARRSFVPVALLLSASIAAEPGFRVEWTGALRDVHREGDARPRIALADLGDAPGTFALGPLAGLRGEITVIDGRVAIARAADGAVRVSADAAGIEAPFLVYGRVAAWTRHTLPDDVRDLAALERRLPGLARAAGLDPAAPFPFKVETATSTLRYHVIDNPDPGDRVTRPHEELMRRFAIERAPATLLGVHSTGHAGTFTHHGQSTHVHVISADGAGAGHVDAADLGDDAVLFLPAP